MAAENKTGATKPAAGEKKAATEKPKNGSRVEIECEEGEREGVRGLEIFVPFGTPKESAKMLILGSSGGWRGTEVEHDGEEIRMNVMIGTRKAK